MAKAVAQGARVALGGQPLEGKGYFYPPTLLLDVRQEMDIIHEETFGPVLPVVAFRPSMRRWRWPMTAIMA